MSSFYGNGGGGSGISPAEVDGKIQTMAEELKNHIIISKTQPTVQKAGDLWFIITSDDNNNNGNG